MELFTAAELNWTDLTCAKLTQLHDALLVPSRQRHEIDWLQGCSARTAVRELQTRPPWILSLEYMGPELIEHPSSVQFRTVRPRWTLLYSLWTRCRVFMPLCLYISNSLFRRLTEGYLDNILRRKVDKGSHRGAARRYAPADGSSTVAYRFAANQAICVSPWIPKSRRIYVRPQTGPQSAHLWCRQWLSCRQPACL